MIHLGINEKMVLLETKRHRVVGIGRHGFRIALKIETPQLDAMGERSWVTQETLEYDRDGELGGQGELAAETLLDALDELRSTRKRLASMMIEHEDLTQARVEASREGL